MGKLRWRREEVRSVELKPATPGSQAVFLVEARSRVEQRKVRELFEALAELAEVAPLCEGIMMAYVVQLCAGSEGSPTGALFAKIEAVLKEEFAFSLVERSFNDVIYHLVASLCEDSQGEMLHVPRCGICNEPEPFPTRVTLRDTSGRGVIEACYCARCSAQQADPSDRQFLRGLLAADRHGLQELNSLDLVAAPADGDEAVARSTYRIAS
jgi:hypothetical protein